MYVYRLREPIEAPDRFAIALLPPLEQTGPGPHILFEAADGRPVLHVHFDYERRAVGLVTSGYGGAPLPEALFPCPSLNPAAGFSVQLDLDGAAMTLDACGERPIRIAGALPASAITAVRIGGADVQSFHHMGSALQGVDWRRYALPSGRPSTTSPFINREALEPGVSFIVRAKNEAENIAACLSGIAPFAQDIVFVDNGSTDSTLQIASDLAKRHTNIRVHSYPIRVPRVGREHAEAVMAGSANTLGEYYNWALSKARCFNFTKWDADFLTIPQNMAEMYRTLDLATRGDNICLYYTGMEVYTDGRKWWIDEATMQHEYRLFSKKHGCSWVDIPPWEELDQTYLFKSRKIYFEKPIYLEVFRLDRDEFANRGLYLKDARDRARYGYLQHYNAHGRLPKNFREVSGPGDPAFASMRLTPEHRRMKDRADAIWSSIPSVVSAEGRVVDPAARVQQAKLLVLIMSCEKNKDRMDKIRRSWAKDLIASGITHYFVVGRPGQPATIVDDVLYLNCPDNYEGLPRKTEAMLRYFAEQSAFDFMLKIDDDTVLNVNQLFPSKFWKRDYSGGVVAGGWGLQADWHFGKCDDTTLNATPYSGAFIGTWYAGGCAYFLSRRFAQSALTRSDVFAAELYEDKAVGDALRGSGALIGDLQSSFDCVDAAVWSEGGHGATLLVFDVPRDGDYGRILDTMKTADPAGWNKDDGVRVTTDWCDVDLFFRTELISEALS